MAIVLGFGEIILPAFPPPIMANKTDGLLYPAFSAIAMAMGATVITEISTKTPTAQMIMVATATDTRAKRCPSFLTITSAIFSAAPVLMRAPAKIPEVRMRSTDDIILCAPDTMVPTVPVRPPPPTIPPMRAPRIRL